MIDIENDHQHIMNFIDGFESIVKQYRDSGFVNVSGTEGYCVGVLRANALQYDITKGFENFISDGIKKLCDMISNFFKAIWDFFFGSDKKIAKAEESAKETKKSTTNAEKSINNLSNNTDGSSQYSRIEKVNSHGKRIRELLDKAVKYMEGDENLSDRFKEYTGNLKSEDLSSELTNIFGTLEALTSRIKSNAEKLDSLKTKIKELKIPEGNRLDKSATNKILKLVDSFMDASLTYFIHTKMTLNECESSYDSVFKLIGREGYTDQECKSFLRVIQMLQKFIGKRLKWLDITVIDLKSEIDSLNKLLEKKD